MTFQKTLGPNGTVIAMVSGKACREKKAPGPEIFMHSFYNLEKNTNFGYHCGAHKILKRVPKSIVF